MTVPVRYQCPRCGAIATIERDAALADKAVTGSPIEGWEYATPRGDVEDADGVRFVCGEGAHFEDGGCGEAFYLHFVRFEAGEEIEPPVPGERVTLADPVAPASPRGPEGPPGPGSGGRYP